MPATPAATAFCTISNETRPLTTSSWSVAGSAAVEQRVPDHLVDGVVPADVLAHHSSSPRAAGERGRVDGAGAVEGALPGAHPVGEFDEHVARHRPAVGVRFGLRSSVRSSTSALHTPQAAEVTNARGRAAHAGAQRDVHAVGVVLAARPQGHDVGRRTHAGLDDQPAGDQFEVVPGRAHQGRDRLAVEAEDERGFDGEIVRDRWRCGAGGHRTMARRVVVTLMHPSVRRSASSIAATGAGDPVISST